MTACMKTARRGVTLLRAVGKLSDIRTSWSALLISILEESSALFVGLVADLISVGIPEVLDSM